MSMYSFIAILFSFVFTLFLLPKWIFRAKKAGLVGKDVHKNSEEKIPEVGGLIVVCGFLAGILVYIAFRVFVFQDASNILTLFAAITAILIAAIIGLVDDILGWKIGLRQFQKAILTISIAIPIMVINAGHSTMNFPIIGAINFGILYPLFLVPIGIMATSNAFNMMGGYNGLEAGMGIIILSTLSYISFVNGTYWVSMIGVCMVAALLAFLFYNWSPAKLFPGDTLTYPVGAIIGIMAILANIEKFAIILFLLFIIQFLLKLRGLMQKESFSKPLSDGSLTNQYEKIYGMEHLAVRVLKTFKKKVYEPDVVASLLVIQIALSALTISYFLCC